MDIKSTTSLQDRIKALNFDKVSPISPIKTPIFKKKDSQASERKYKTEASSDESSPKNEIYSTSQNHSPIICILKNETQTQETDLKRILNENENENDVTCPYSLVPNNIALKNQSILQCSSDMSPYSDIPNNVPANLEQDIVKVASSALRKTSNGVTMPNSSSPLKDDSTETEIYANPRNIPIDDDKEKAPEPNEINSRISKVRRTIKDPHMRIMVDMSDLLLKSEDDITIESDRSYSKNDDDSGYVVMSPLPVKRSQSLVNVDVHSTPEESIYKRPSLPAVTEQSAFPKFASNVDSPSPNLSPDFSIHREPSYKSTCSTESRRSGNYSDSSDLSSADAIRPRNYSDVSVTFDEDNYITFKSLNKNNDLLPNERTLVIVKGETAFTGKLTLATEPTSSLNPVYEDSPTKMSTDEHSPTTPSSKIRKGKTRKVFGKISKAVKHKISSPKPTSSGKSATSSPKHSTHSPKKTPQELETSSFMTLPMESEPRHRTQSSAVMLSERTMPVPERRPKSMFTDLKSSDEGIYYDPSEEGYDTDNNDTLTIEVIQEEENGTVSNIDTLEYGVSRLSAEKRSQSLASLNCEFMESTESVRRLSDNIGKYTQDFNHIGSNNLNMTNSTPPVPPPKYKAMRRKSERKMAESDSMTSSNYTPSYNNSGAKLRNKYSNDNTAERRNWPNGRPPSMPLDMPPSPPPVTSPKPPNKSSSRNDTAIDEENEYVSPGMKPRIPDVGHRTEANIPLKMQRAKQNATTDSYLKSDEQVNKQIYEMAANMQDVEDAIYHTVGEPEVMSNGTNRLFSSAETVSSVQNNKTQHLQNETPKNKEKESNNENDSSEATERSFEIAPPLLPRIINTKPKPPEKPKPSFKLNSGSNSEKLLTKPTPGIPLKPNLNKLSSQNTIRFGPKVPPKPNNEKTMKINIPVFKDPSSLPRDIPASVKPPPRPSKLKKITENAIKDIPEKNATLTEEENNSYKVSLRSSTVAELGKLLSQSGPMSPQHFKFTQQKTIRQNTEEKLNPGENKMSDDSHKHKLVSPHFRKTATNSSSIANNATSAISSSIVKMSPEKSNTKKFSPTLTDPQPASKIAVSTKQISRRPVAKRPSIAPPPRPNVPPPPRPDQVSSTEKNKSSDQPEKSVPPSRPPPPSSDKIKAAEQRRKKMSLTVQDEVESEYHDVLLKHEEDNPYADIDDDAFESARGNTRANQKEYMPTPPSRSKHAMKRAVNTVTAISAMKGNLRRQNTNSVVTKQQSFVSSHGAYSSSDEGIYAGIDDNEFSSVNS